LSDKEISALRSWVSANDFLSGTYPVDEINSLLHSIFEDQKIDPSEREMLLAFCSNLVEFKDSLNLVEKDYVDLREKYSISGICAANPIVNIIGHTFCFTGESYRGTRKEISDVIETLGGICRGSVSKKTDYLIVGNGGNPCWAYACYGRKIEEAVNLRRQGGHVIIVNETDFWAAVDAVDNP